MYYVYVIRCKDATLYTGYAVNVNERIKKHNEGTGARYTRGRTPVELVYVEEWKDKSSAMRREIEIKRYSKSKKEQLIEGWKNEYV
ncbi:GIY-YIG nuclease family protein [Aneurinibacillus tyrosinisolvens]|uniref:GIY-YIG nuclease family protein n=1 Tax=Aneurinibacillus tyrosinisolvens TaxID=1443435 RepID=UPI00063FCCD6|nr:GIY-YIG nuclease family protein [Aneurinibacillus tyrosinisolvens]